MLPQNKDSKRQSRKINRGRESQRRGVLNAKNRDGKTKSWRKAYDGRMVGRVLN